MEALKTSTTTRCWGKGKARARHGHGHTIKNTHTHTVAATLLLQGICVADCAQVTWTCGGAGSKLLLLLLLLLVCTPVAGILHATGYWLWDSLLLMETLPLMLMMLMMMGSNANLAYENFMALLKVKVPYSAIRIKNEKLMQYEKHN